MLAYIAFAIWFVQVFLEHNFYWIQVKGAYIQNLGIWVVRGDQNLRPLVILIFYFKVCKIKAK